MHPVAVHRSAFPMATPSESDLTEQIIAQFRQKILHVILASRIPHSPFASAGHGPSSSHSAKRDRWFNLALPGEVYGVLMDPLVVDVLLVPCNGEADGSDCGAEGVVERWFVESVGLDPWSPAPQLPHDGSFQRRTYKKSIILLRSFYVLLRLLPAEQVFRRLCSSSQAYNYNLTYRVPSFNTPFSRAEEAEFKLHRFTPVETPFGQLVVSVQYRPSLANFPLAVASPMPPIIIPDYVGSPVAERIRAFPASLPDRVSRPFTSQHPPRDIRTPASPFDNPSSCNSDPMMHQPSTSAPGRPVLGLGNSQPEHYGHPVPYNHTFTGDRKNSNFDDFKLSPPFSTSPPPSPSPHGGLQSKLRSGTAPLSIPIFIHSSDSFKGLLPPLSPRNTRPDISCQESPSRSRSLRKPEWSHGGICTSSHMCTPKGSKDSRDDFGKFSVFPSGGSPRCKRSIKDDEDEDFTCPFAVDDVDTLDSQTRSRGSKEESDYSSSHKSQDADVGALVLMLRTADPLQRYQSCTLQSSESNSQVSVLSSALSRKTRDALEELQSYKELKNLLLSKTGGRSLESPRTE